MGNSEKPKSCWREHRQSIKHKWIVPFIFVEWLCEWVSHLLKQCAFLDILGHAGRLTILIAVIFYFMESEDRRKARHYQAWQVINAATGRTSSGGRIDALQDLNKDKVSLAGLQISYANLRSINLENANLYQANLSGAHLYQANLSKAFLFEARLNGAFLYEASLFGADLRYANLFGADFSFADLRIANLLGAINFRDIKSIELANIHGVKKPPDGFIEWAEEKGAVSIEDYQEWKILLRKKEQEKTKEK